VSEAMDPIEVSRLEYEHEVHRRLLRGDSPDDTDAALAGLFDDPEQPDDGDPDDHEDEGDDDA